MVCIKVAFILMAITSSNDSPYRYIEQYIKNPICKPKSVGEIGTPARALCEWVHATYSSDLASREMYNMRREFERMTDELVKCKKESSCDCVDN